MLEKFFILSKNCTDVKTELLAGITTSASMDQGALLADSVATTAGVVFGAYCLFSKFSPLRENFPGFIYVFRFLDGHTS